MASVVVYFCVFVGILFIVGIVSGRSGTGNEEDYILAERSLGKYVLGLSAGATGNSGFIMLGAVGLGYSSGMTFVFMPVAWFLGDLIFWRYFPGRLNRIARESNVRTIPELLASDNRNGARLLRVVAGALLVAIVGGYGASQLIAGRKTLNVFFGVAPHWGVVLTAAIVLGYCLWGGFRASVWTDVVQAIVMLMVTTFVLIWACIDLQLLSGSVPEELSTDILVPFSAWNPMNIVAFFLVWSLCAVGFGLSQPHVVARYFAEKNPDETRKARWVYILFLQYTWIGMTVFGVLASGLVKEIEDEELALPTYVMGRFAAPVVAFVMAGVFSAVASTLDSIFLAVGNILSVDVLPCLFGERRTFRENWFHRTASLAVAVIVIMCSMYTTEGVFYLTARSVTITTATIAPAMLLRVLCPGVGGRTLTSCILVGLAVGVIGLWLDWGAATVFGIESVAAFTAATVVGLILRRHATRSGGEAK